MNFLPTRQRMQSIGVPTEMWQKYPITDYDTVIFLEHFQEPRGSKVLVVGAHDEPSANIMAEMGMQVTGIDLREYDKDLPPCNYRFLRSDFCGMDLAALGKFDCFVALSAIEHFGMGTYLEGGRHRYYDVIAMRKAWELLNEGGTAYITVPMCGYFGEVWPHWRTYDIAAANERLVQDFQLEYVHGIVAGDLIIEDKLHKAGSHLTPEELAKFSGMPPHYSALIKMRKVPIKRLAPNGR